MLTEPKNIFLLFAIIPRFLCQTGLLTGNRDSVVKKIKKISNFKNFKKRFNFFFGIY